MDGEPVVAAPETPAGADPPLGEGRPKKRKSRKSTADGATLPVSPSVEAGASSSSTSAGDVVVPPADDAVPKKTKKKKAKKSAAAEDASGKAGEPAAASVPHTTLTPATPISPHQREMSDTSTGSRAVRPAHHRRETSDNASPSASRMASPRLCEIPMGVGIELATMAPAASVNPSRRNSLVPEPSAPHPAMLRRLTSTPPPLLHHAPGSASGLGTLLRSRTQQAAVHGPPPAFLGKGTSMEGATRTLVQAFDEALENHARTQPKTRTLIWQVVARPEYFLMPVLGVILIAYYSYQVVSSAVDDNDDQVYQFRATGTLVEGFLLIVFFILVVWHAVREKRLAINEVAVKARNLRSALVYCNYNNIPVHSIPYLSSVSTSEVVREGSLRTIPSTFLVQGDIVRMRVGERVPTRLKFIAPPGCQLHVKKPGDDILEEWSTLSSVHPVLLSQPPETFYYFTVVDTPLKSFMDELLASSRQPSVTARQKERLEIVMRRIVFVVFVVASLIINVLHVALVEKASEHLFESLFVQPTYVLIPVLSLVLPILWWIQMAMANATLYCLFDALQLSKKTVEPRDYEDDDFDFESAVSAIDVLVPRMTVFKRFLRLLVGVEVSTLFRTTNMLQELGNTTVLCVLDKEGTVAKPFPLAEEIHFIHGSEARHVRLCVDPTDVHRIVFESDDYAQFLSSLKPLGLNFLLNTNLYGSESRRDKYTIKRPELRSFGPVSPARLMDMTYLSKAMGFTDEAVRSFVRRRDIFVLPQFAHRTHSTPSAFGIHHHSPSTPIDLSKRVIVERDLPTLPSLVSVILEDPRTGSYQLLSEGTPEFLLQYCTEFWDGSEVRHMTPDDVGVIMNVVAECRARDLYCIGYAYRPLDLSEKSPVVATSDAATVELPFNRLFGRAPSATAAATDEKPPEKAPLLHPGMLQRTFTNDILDDDSSSQLMEMDEAGFPIVRKVTPLLQHQVFIGFVALQHEVREGVREFIETLHEAGVRFVYFSEKTDRECKEFAHRLGVETDWNSCIALSNEFAEDDPTDLTEEKSQLPRGIENVRPHLENVDDVPLLVPLFSHCTPKAVCEMIRILQENGEVVCTLGSSAKHLNFGAFNAADLALSLEVLHPRLFPPFCDVDNPLPLDQPPPELGRRNLDGYDDSATVLEHQRNSMMHVAAQINALPCALHVSRDTSPSDVLLLMREARRLSDNVRQSMAFAIASSLTVALAELLSQCLLLPPMLCGYQILWICCIIVPILTLPIAMAKEVTNVMNQLPLKNKAPIADMGRFARLYLVRFVPIVILVVLVFLFSWFGLSEAASYDDVFLGPNRIQWRAMTEHQQWALAAAQNAALWMFVFYLTIVSATFLSRHAPIWEFPPYRSRLFVTISLGVLALQSVFFAISLSPTKDIAESVSLSMIPGYAYGIAFAASVLVLLCQEIAKLRDRTAFRHFQRKAKLVFDTKLGMHSPV